MFGRKEDFLDSNSQAALKQREGCNPQYMTQTYNTIFYGQRKPDQHYVAQRDTFLQFSVKKNYRDVFYQYLAGLAVIQIPELDMSVAHSYKVRAVLRERHACHLTGHLVSCYNNVFLQ